MMTAISIAPPWVGYQRKLKVLFELDPQVTVGDVTQTDGGYAMDIEISDHEKFIAFDRVMPTKVVFGNVTLFINLIDTVGGSDDEWISLYAKVFEGNRRLKDVRILDGMGFKRAYVRFEPEVLQFPNDDLTDLGGNWSGLAQDIAREIFVNNTHGLSFCTADIRENSGEVSALGVEFTPGV